MFLGTVARRFVLLFATASSLLGQSKPAAETPPAASFGTTPSQIARPLTPAEAKEAQLAADTARLYQLAQELKVELDKTTKDTLSLTVVKKAAEIEKLAHSISERMKSR